MNRITKFVFVLFVFSLTVFFTHESLATGFSKGNSFETTPISGAVFVQCPAQPGAPVTSPSQQFFSCAETLWSPDITDYFVGPQGVQASQVSLTATHEDGSQRQKSSDYDSSKGRSKSQFNLGIQTLTQKPLLKMGVNKIHYILSLNNQTVDQGDFEVSVSAKPELRCPTGNIYSGNYFDCQNSFNACDQYFERYNYCQ